MKNQNMTLLARKAVLSKLEIPENIVNFEIDQGFKRFYADRLGIVPLTYSIDTEKLKESVKTNEENKNNVDLGNTLQDRNTFHGSSNKEVAFNTPKQEQIYTVIKPAASQGILLESVNEKHLQHFEAVGYLDIFQFILLVIVTGLIGAELLKKITVENK